VPCPSWFFTDMRVIVNLVSAVSTSTGSDGRGMETLVERCAGLDVHKDSVTACVPVSNTVATAC
jgi:hypothetical protein